MLLGVRLVETLGAHLEAQALHRLEDVVGAFVGRHLQVAEGVVAFLVVHVEQRGDLREAVGDVLEQGLGTLAVAFLLEMELHKHHPLPGVGVADHDVSQQAGLPAYVEIGHPRGVGKVAYGVAYLVVQVVHEHALLDGQHLVESSGDVEADGVHIVIYHAAFHLLAGEPPLVAAFKLHLVAVGSGLGGA